MGSLLKLEGVLSTYGSIRAEQKDEDSWMFEVGINWIPKARKLSKELRVAKTLGLLDWEVKDAYESYVILRVWCQEKNAQAAANHLI